MYVNIYIYMKHYEIKMVHCTRVMLYRADVTRVLAALAAAGPEQVCSQRDVRKEVSVKRCSYRGVSKEMFVITI